MGSGGGGSTGCAAIYLFVFLSAAKAFDRLKCKPNNILAVPLVIFITAVNVSLIKVKGKVHVLAIALLACFFKTRSALQSWKWQLIGIS